MKLIYLISRVLLACICLNFLAHGIIGKKKFVKSHFSFIVYTVLISCLFTFFPGVSERELQDKDTRDFIYDFIDRHGGIEAALEEVENRNRTPAPAPPPRQSSIARPPPPSKVCTVQSSDQGHAHCAGVRTAHRTPNFKKIRTRTVLLTTN